ncbi:MAG TPA: glutathione peroxidase [Bryobacteraceae bacterium]|nr:glutathione peroxidase [Bryobacteraceae bacterium]
MAFTSLGLSANLPTSVHEFTLKDIDGKSAPLSAYKGKVILLVNVASNCGFTGQYEALQSVYSKYKDRGLVVVGVPANNFGRQEPGTDQEIKAFCTRKYNVTFPMLSKVSVKGEDKTPLYQYLTDKTLNPKTGGEIRWNFTKFLIGRDGKVIDRFESMTAPDSSAVIAAIEKALAQ